MRRASFFASRPTPRQVNVGPEIQAKVDASSPGGTIDLSSDHYCGYLLCNHTIYVPANRTFKGCGPTKCTMAKSYKTVVLNRPPNDYPPDPGLMPDGPATRELIVFNSKNNGNPIYSVGKVQSADPPAYSESYAVCDVNGVPTGIAEGVTSFRVLGHPSIAVEDAKYCVLNNANLLSTTEALDRHHLQSELVYVTNVQLHLPGPDNNPPPMATITVGAMPNNPPRFSGDSPYDIPAPNTYPISGIEGKVGRPFSTGTSLVLPRRTVNSALVYDFAKDGGKLQDITLDGRTQRANTDTNLNHIYQLAAVVGVHGFQLESVRVHYFYQVGISFFTCRDISLHKANVDESPYNRLSYALLFKECRGVRVSSCTAGAVRNHVLFGNSNSDGLVRDSILEPIQLFPYYAFPWEGRSSHIDIGHGPADRRLQFRNIHAPNSNATFANPTYLDGGYWLVMQNCTVKEVRINANGEQVQLDNCQMQNFFYVTSGKLSPFAAILPKSAFITNSTIFNVNGTPGVFSGYQEFPYPNRDAFQPFPGIGVLALTNCNIDVSTASPSNYAVLFKTSVSTNVLTLTNCTLRANSTPCMGFVKGRDDVIELEPIMNGTRFAFRGAPDGAIYVQGVFDGVVSGTGNVKPASVQGFFGPQASTWTIPSNFFG